MLGVTKGLPFGRMAYPKDSRFSVCVGENVDTNKVDRNEEQQQ